jgi:hypothetical protein
MATLTPAPSHAEPVVDQTGRATVPWYRWFTQMMGEALAGVVHSVTGSPPIASSGGTTPVISLLPSGVTVGTYGDSTHVAQVTVDSTGRVTNAVNVPISGAGGGGSWIPLVSGAEPPVFITDSAGVLILVAGP